MDQLTGQGPELAGIWLDWAGLQPSGSVSCISDFYGGFHAVTARRYVSKEHLGGR